MDENTVVTNPMEQAAQGDAAQVAVQDAVADQPETGVTTEAAAPQEKSASERFAYALKMRVSEESAKIERETAKKFEPDASFAQNVRRYFPGKTDADIENDLIAAQVKVEAQRKGISEELAREIIELRNGIMRPNTPVKQSASPAETTPASDAWLNRLARQRDAIKAAHGVDVLETLTDEEEAQVMQGDMDLQEVFSKRTHTPPVNRGVANQPAPKDFSKMTDAEYDAFRKELTRKGRIDVRSD